jgi:excinuclease ABC subunit A
MAKNKIIIKGAKVHNLKNIDLEIPRDKFIVITGISGSGKSSLAFDTIYAEGQRRYVESLSAYARQFLGQMDKPDVEYIEGLSPAISIEQKTTSKNPRSTVGTVTEIHDYLRLLFARIGIPHCPQCGREIAPQTLDQIMDSVLELPEGTKVHVLAPVVKDRKGEYRQLFEDLKQEGYSRVRADGQIYALDDDIELGRYQKHNIDVVIDRLIIKDGIKERLADSVETALHVGGGVVMVQVVDDERELLFSEHLSCAHCQLSFEALEPAMFSFNNPRGACPRCQGLGNTLDLDPDLVVPDPSLSILEGAIDPWGKSPDGYYMQTLKSVAKKYNFSANTPFEKLSKKHRDIILYGSNERINLRYTPRDKPGVWEHYSKYEGIIPNLKRRYRESSSEDMREKIQQYMSSSHCPQCKGRRLKPYSLAVTLNATTIDLISEMSVKDAIDFFNDLTLSERDMHIARRILKEINARLGFLMDVGLDYLNLSRSAGTLSGGEAQRIRLATQIGSSLVGVLYILDEPSIGLHHRDNDRLIGMLKRLRDLGNTIIVVEHDMDTMLSADYIIDMGPGAGVHGGEIVAAGTPKEIINNNNSLTGRYLAGKKQIDVPSNRRTPNGWLTLKGAQENNLKHIDVIFPLRVMTCVTGVSGSGKSTLVNEILNKALANKLHRARSKPGKHSSIEGIRQIDKVITIDQSPIGRTPRSNPATYTNVFTPIRELFAITPESKIRGYKPGRFSFNVRGGRCESCHGDGIITIEMHFLPDVYVRCEVCHGSRYNNETLEITYKGKNIADVLNMTVEEALEFFKHIPKIHNKLRTIYDVGLGYIKLGQPATTLSGGEAQRIKLSTELSRKSTGRTVYILDEPTTGLHFDDVKKLLGVLNRLTDAGNTVIVIEHNLDVIKTADYIIDLGPEGGERGGMVVAKGTPEEVADESGSYTGIFLANVLNNGISIKTHTSLKLV